MNLLLYKRYCLFLILATVSGYFHARAGNFSGSKKVEVIDAVLNYDIADKLKKDYNNLFYGYSERIKHN